MYLVSYDIVSDKLRRKIAKCLENYGKRIQYSVFECDLNEIRFKKLYGELLEIACDIDDGSIRFYYLCGKCYPRLRIIGKKAPSLFRDNEDVIVI